MPRRRSSDKDNRAPGQRQLRVGEELRHLLAELFERGDMRDPDLRDASITVTVTRVQPMRIIPGADRTIVVRETATAVDEAQP